MSKVKVFIDGSAGTTGLQVRQRLESRSDVEVMEIPQTQRKDAAVRKEYLNAADAVILCLPDDASREAASFIEPSNNRTVLIDASTAFRVDDSWTYGFPELSSDQREKLQKSKRISNPGCYPTGFISITRPLVDAGILPVGTPITVNAISGYSGGGKGLIEIYESGGAEPWGGYGYGLSHKHIAEMCKYSNIDCAPIFQPQVGSFAQGMVVSVPLHYSWLKKETTGADLHNTLSKHYQGSSFVKVMPLGENGAKDANLLERDAFLRPDTLADTNIMQLFVFHNDSAGQAVICARLDNLGKGASGAAVQNMNIALGLDETVGL
eukprot:CAMPEP_0113301944 /NCGR_PEP_ID=MMETSP0010_2-20120614/2957_1 /TAXON_ID=216773 ORGANISM="Corethron hystrix, Strain 308" /NCGR_SAMPLE_ID=MMETSP0010_2 /ASSEMBLY_ACC=CAM_ASM_000155 /LENGTH=321 /DNA_ID=CAMNT_0000155641 /DNA_START=232 /DNA_END=1197 /DNA_ORIENTATION=+ /assembly_acc=CAM_ASM_000155